MWGGSVALFDKGEAAQHMWLTHLDGIRVEMRSVQFRVAGDAKHAERGADFVLQDFQRNSPALVVVVD